MSPPPFGTGLGVQVKPETAIRSLVDWASGPLVEIQISGPLPDSCSNRHRPAWQPTIRMPQRPIDDSAFYYGQASDAHKKLYDKLGNLISIRRAAKIPNDTCQHANAQAPTGCILEQRVTVCTLEQCLAGCTLKHCVEETKHALRNLGAALYDLAIRPEFKKELKSGRLFLELSTDESLSHLPWELIHDTPPERYGITGLIKEVDDKLAYYCLKHFVGRFVNRIETTPPRQVNFGVRPAKPEDLVVLLIVVPDPNDPSKPPVYAPLPGARAEMEAIIKALEDLKLSEASFRVLYDKNATFENVRDQLKGEERKHIIHFCGHAEFNPDESNASALLLYGGEKLRTGQIVDFFTHAKPILCFINSCNSARTPVPPPSPDKLLDKNRYNLYGLGKAFLETGTYLLGANWEIEDVAAETFAGSFYHSLLVERLSLGEAVRNARLKCKEVSSSDFAWASYVLYGDPRVQFQMGSVSSVVRVRSDATTFVPRASR